MFGVIKSDYYEWRSKMNNMFGGDALIVDINVIKIDIQYDMLLPVVVMT